MIIINTTKTIVILIEWEDMSSKTSISEDCLASFSVSEGNNAIIPVPRP